MLILSKLCFLRQGFTIVHVLDHVVFVIIIFQSLINKLSLNNLHISKNSLQTDKVNKAIKDFFQIICLISQRVIHDIRN